MAKKKFNQAEFDKREKEWEKKLREESPDAGLFIDVSDAISSGEMDYPTKKSNTHYKRGFLKRWTMFTCCSFCIFICSVLLYWFVFLDFTSILKDFLLDLVGFGDVSIPVFISFVIIIGSFVVYLFQHFILENEVRFSKSMVSRIITFCSIFLIFILSLMFYCNNRLLFVTPPPPNESDFETQVVKYIDSLDHYAPSYMEIGNLSLNSLKRMSKTEYEGSTTCDINIKDFSFLDDLEECNQKYIFTYMGCSDRNLLFMMKSMNTSKGLNRILGDFVSSGDTFEYSIKNIKLVAAISGSGSIYWRWNFNDSSPVIQVKSGSQQSNQIASKINTEPTLVPPPILQEQVVTQQSTKKKQSTKISGKTYTEPTTGMEFILIEGGCYQMGSPISEKGRNDNEGPIHEVCVDDFYMGKYEVTNRQFRLFMAGHNSGIWREGVSQNKDNQPAVKFKGTNMQKYIKWLNRKTGNNYRLPTEAEWEYAARAGTKTAQFWGESQKDACRYANVRDQAFQRDVPYKAKIHNCDDGYIVSAPVGQFLPNNFGLYDMLGNVSEWTGDYFDEKYYSNSPRNNPKGPASINAEKEYVIRGSSFADYRPDLVRFARRSRFNASDGGGFTVGFRLVLSPN